MVFAKAINEEKKVLLAAVNAKYIHTSLSVRTLYRYANSSNVEFAEYTINEHTFDVLKDIYEKHCNTVMFSCYIWNIEFVLEVAANLKKVSPKTQIILGGPEVTFDCEYYLEKYPFIDAIMYGEGEETLKEWLESGDDINGMALRKNGEIIKNPPREAISDITQIPFPYTDEDLEKNKNKLIYYESSRGCPFNCSYCISSTDHGVRFRDIEAVKSELLKFTEHKVKIVKFTDRTFNANRKRTCELMKFLIENAGETTFHFEVAADLINDEVIEVLKTAPKRLFQLEIGVQSTNGRVIDAIDRKTDFEKIRYAVTQIKEQCEIHMHMDLIAGLPYEDINSFKKSFDDVFSLRPDVLQLGFLKLLRGTKIREEESLFNYRYTDNPPYEILENDFMTFDDILLLKGIEDVFEKYYNSGVFKRGIEYLLKQYESAFEFFKKLWEFYFEKGYNSVGQSRNSLYEILCEFEGGQSEAFRDLLKMDYLENNKNSSSPSWSLIPYDRDLLKLRFEILTEDFVHEYLSEYSEISVKEAVKFLHFERFLYRNEKREEHIVIFDRKYDRIVYVP